ncbi:ferric reductase-like transmembrane domain-containing protein [Candidatus Collierbacteria bacterium]|nr:ferric reductase-like transmembrane domain-containing protein [Candidatus Collierbacteria bacterium]
MKIASSAIVIISLVLSAFLAWSKSTIILGQLAFWTLTLVIFTKPLARLFPTIGLFKTLLALRRYTGIASGIFVIAHVLSQILPGFGLTDILSYAASAGPRDFQFWGLIGLILILPLLVTANNFATNLLKRNWFRLHKLIHPLYIVILVHRALQPKPGYLLTSIVIFILLYGSRLLAARDTQFFVPKLTNQA